MKSAHIGQCQICERDQKLRADRVPGILGLIHTLVNHGYRRPGDGIQRGQCLGTFELPFELSCDRLVTYKAHQEHALDAKRVLFKKLRAQEVTHLLVLKHSYVSNSNEFVEFACGVTPLPTWEREHAKRLSSVRSDVEGLESQIARMTGRIVGWKLQPLRLAADVG